MIKFITEYVLPLVGTFLVGVLGWFATKVVANPILEFYELRKQTREELFFTANVGKIQLDNEENKIKNRYFEACDNLRRLAARFDAMDQSAFFALKIWLRFRKYDLKKVSQPLTGLSNSMDDVRGLKSKYRPAINKALKFSDDL